MYHYTTIYHLPFILRDGLRPRAMGAVNHLNDWKLGLQLAGSNISTIRPLLWGTRSPIPDKTATGAFHGLPPIRLSVPNDGFLKDWGRFYPPDEATYLRRLGRKVGSNPNDWFVRLEKISPHLVKVDSEDIPSYRFLSDTDVDVEGVLVRLYLHTGIMFPKGLIPGQKAYRKVEIKNG